MNVGTSKNEEFVRDRYYQFQPPVFTKAIQQEGEMTFVDKVFSRGSFLDEENGYLVFLGKPDGENKEHFFRIKRMQIDSGAVVVVPGTSTK